MNCVFAERLDVGFLGGLHILRAAYIGWRLLKWMKLRPKVKKVVASGRVDMAVCVKGGRNLKV